MSRVLNAVKFLVITLLVIALIGQPIFAKDSDDGIRVIVTYKSKVSSSDVSQLDGLGGTVKRVYHLIPAVSISLPRFAVEKIKNNPRVTRVEADIEVEALDELSTNWGVQKVKANLVWPLGIMGQGVTVAVIDTGIDYTHPDLAANYAGGYDFVNNDADPMDDNGHGTHVAGIIAGVQDGLGVVGVAPQAKLYALKVLSSGGYGYVSNIIAAVEWAVDHGIMITNNSYGSVSPSLTEEEAFNAAYQAGVLSIAAAGNSGGSPTYDTSLYPARFASVIAVAATDINNNIAGFSSSGPATEVSAPGVNIMSSLIGGGYGYKSGTSMACPHAVGVAALIKSAHPSWNNETIRGQMRASALDLGPSGHDWQYGFGLVDAVAGCGELIPNPPPMPSLPGDPIPPTVKNVGITDVTEAGATLHALVSDLGNSTYCDVVFYVGIFVNGTLRYMYPKGTVRVYSANTTVQYKVEGLSSSTEYVFESTAIGSNGKSFTDYNYKRFVTLPETRLSPIVEERTTQNITATSANIRGWVDDMGNSSWVDVSFYIGPVVDGSAEFSPTPVIKRVTSLLDQFFEYTVTGLIPNTEYALYAYGTGSNGLPCRVPDWRYYAYNTFRTLTAPTPPPVKYLVTKDTALVLVKNRLQFETRVVSTSPVSGASVTVNVTDPSGNVKVVAGTSDSKGEVVVNIKGNPAPGTWLATIINVTNSSGYIWDKDGSMISASITVPKKR